MLLITLYGPLIGCTKPLHPSNPKNILLITDVKSITLVNHTTMLKNMPQFTGSIFQDGKENRAR